MSKESAFQFTRPVLKSLVVTINDSFEPTDEGKININIITHVNKQQLLQETDENVAEVILSVEIGSQEDMSSPFHIVAEEAANFKWSKGQYSEDETDRLLKGNAPSLLLSYLRPVIAMVTSASAFPAYNIPFIDLTKGV